MNKKYLLELVFYIRAAPHYMYYKRAFYAFYNVLYAQSISFVMFL